MSTELFRPLPLFRNAHLQTLAAAQLCFLRAPPSHRVAVTLPDGDRLALEMSVPPGWAPPAPTVLLLHGATGSHRSPYMVRAARALWTHGVRAGRLNLRGCGSGVGWARRPYSLGGSADVFAVVRALRAAEPASPLTLVGFSLGGNLALKLAGELGPAGPRFVQNLLAFCPGTDLLACYRRIHRPANRLYEYAFVANLRRELRDRLRAFPDLPRIVVPPRLNLFEFDDCYSAPALGFAGTADYYRRCSANPLIPHIHIPSRIIHAADDPICEPRALDAIPLPPAVEVLTVPHGGHLGFLARPGASGILWMNAQLLRWLLLAPQAAPDASSRTSSFHPDADAVHVEMT